MAHYAALWTSSRDPEFIQIKKVKQLSERNLAMAVADMKEEHRRHVKKAQEHIRENQDILDRLEKEKQTIARSILARFHKHLRMKETVKLLAFQFRKRRESQQGQNPKGSTKLPRLLEEKPKASRREKRRADSRRILMTHTFPYVYHSHGDKPCPRYDMFLESEEFGPPEITSKERRSSSMMAGQTARAKTQSMAVNIHRPAGRNSESELPPIALTSSTQPSPRPLRKLAMAFKAVHELTKANGGIERN